MSSVFWTLSGKIVPLYILIGLGYIAGKYLHAQKESIATILIYMVAPPVVLLGIISRPFHWNLVATPLILMAVCFIVALAFFWLARLVWQDATANIIAFAAGAGNTGYFGLPVALALYGEQAFTIVVMAILGNVFFESTLGFYLLARANYSVKKSIFKLLRLPNLYAFVLGVTLAALHYQPAPQILEFLGLFKGAYSVLGMMMIGLGLSSVKGFKLDVGFIITTLVARFAVWPLLMSSFVYVDAVFFHIFDPIYHPVLVLIASVPIAANTVVFATELKVYPEKAAAAVFLSTMAALLFIPLLVALQ